MAGKTHPSDDEGDRAAIRAALGLLDEPAAPSPEEPGLDDVEEEGEEAP